MEIASWRSGAQLGWIGCLNTEMLPLNLHPENYIFLVSESRQLSRPLFLEHASSRVRYQTLEHGRGFRH